MNKSNTLIQVNDVRREFKSLIKKDGLKGTIELLLKPNYQIGQALKGVSFEIESGSFVGLIGANGAGKTTLLKILTGLIPPSSGTAKVLGINPFDRPIEFRKKISLVMGQKAQLWWDLPANDAFSLLRAIYQIPEGIYKKRLDQLASMLDVTKHLHTQIRRLSLGERMKMELIGALLHWPEVIFLDEPTIGLDVLAALKLREFLKEFNKTEKATIILTSHNMEDIAQLCPRIIILKEGELIFDGKPGALTKADQERRLKVRLMQNPTVDELSDYLGIKPHLIEKHADSQSDEADEVSHYYLTMPPSEIAVALSKLFQKYQVLDMGVAELSLETVIQRIYEGKTP